MNPSKIRFRCPSCETQLDVPSHLAGVTGPCPTCQATITAPSANFEQDFVSPIPAEPPIPILPTIPQAEPAPAYLPPRETVSRPSVERGHAAFPEHSPPVESTPIPARPPIPGEVRTTPDDPGFPLEEPTPAQSSRESSRKKAPSSGAEPEDSPDTVPSRAREKSAPRRRSRIPSLIFFFLVLLASAALILAVLSTTNVVGLGSISSLFKSGNPGENAETAPAEITDQAATPPRDGLPTEEGASRSLSEDPLAIDPEDATTTAVQAIDDSNLGIEEAEPITPPEGKLPSGQDFRQGETPLPSEIEDEPSESVQVQRALQSFFLAKNLEERAPYLSTTALTMPGIEESIFAKRIPEPIFIRFIDIFRDEKENRTDFYFTVGWDGSRNSPEKPITIELHRWHENEMPRVHAAAFQEAYSEALKRYSLTPQESPAQFHVLGKCVAKCFSDIPNASELATLKMAPFPGTYLTTNAFFRKEGELLDQIKGSMRGAAMEQEIPMTVTIAWSPESQKPRYLELVRIDSFDWHP